MTISRTATVLLSLAFVMATLCCCPLASAGETVTVDWGVVQRAVDAKAYGVNGPYMFDPNAANNTAASNNRQYFRLVQVSQTATSASGNRVSPALWGPSPYFTSTNNRHGS